MACTMFPSLMLPIAIKVAVIATVVAIQGFKAKLLDSSDSFAASSTSLIFLRPLFRAVLHLSLYPGAGEPRNYVRLHTNGACDPAAESVRARASYDGSFSMQLLKYSGWRL